MRAFLGRVLAAIAIVWVVCVPASADTIVDIDFGSLGDLIGDADGLDDGDRIRDVSGNGYHGFWGATPGDIPVIAGPDGGPVIDTRASSGKVFLRDGLNGIPASWDGATTTGTPYFTLKGDESYTFEAIVNFGSSAAGSSGTNGLMGFTGGNEVWWRVQDGIMGFTFDDGPNRISVSSSDFNFSAAFDGDYHNLALTYDASVSGERTITGYLDGVAIGNLVDTTGVPTGTMYDGTNDFYVGAYNTSSSNYFNGLQDHYRISSGVLAPGDFLPVPVPEPGFGPLALTGLAALGWGWRWRRQSA